MANPQNGFNSQKSTLANIASGLNHIDSLLSGIQWAPNLNGKTALTYSFPWANKSTATWATNPQYSSYNEPGSGFALTTLQQQAVRDALATWSQVANITFTEVMDTATNVGDFRFAWTNFNNSGAGAWAGYPNDYWASGGDVWLSNITMGDQKDKSWLPNGYSFFTLIHEVGHALGLKHPFDEAPTLPTLTDTYQYSVMSYTPQDNDLFLDAVPNGVGGYSFEYSYIMAQTPMLYDIAAIQYLYGVNNSHRAGNDIYTFDPAKPFFQTIWDAGGIDTISVFNFSTDCLIDLRDGSFSNIVINSKVLPPGYSGTEPSYNGFNNLAIAFGAIIENATGGSGNDMLIGNAASNVLVGGGGNDKIYGGLGDDILIGGSGDDTLDGGDGIDTAVYDVLSTSATVTKITGGYKVSGAEGLDTLINIEWLQFSDKTIDLRSNAGNDKIYGTPGNDIIFGSAGNDTIDGLKGVDTVIYNGLRASATVTKTSTGHTVSGPEGVDTLISIERLQFADKTLALDIDGNAGQAYRIYQAAFDRTPDNGGLKFWIGEMDNGTSLYSVADGFVHSAEFMAMYGANPSTAQFVAKLYDNVLHRQYDQGGFDYWTGILDRNEATKTQVLASFSESPENQAGVIGVIQNGIELLA